MSTPDPKNVKTDLAHISSENAEVICGAVAASCHCVLNPGHDGPHACDPEDCGGSWLGEPFSPDFEIIAFPGGWS